MTPAFNHIALAVIDLAATHEHLSRLGVAPTPIVRDAGQGSSAFAFFAGGPTNQAFVQLIGIVDEAEAAAARGGARLREAIARGGGAVHLGLAVDDIGAARARAVAAGATVAKDRHPGTLTSCDVLALEADSLGVHVSLVAYHENATARHAKRAAAVPAPTLQLERVDHLAIMAPDLDATTAAWDRILGVSVAGEVQGRGMVIRQLRAGDAMVELLAPNGADSPLAGRPPGLSSSVAFEVRDLDAAVAHVRSRGFQAGDPAAGALPGTRTATIPGTELGGLTLQLLQYV